MARSKTSPTHRAKPTSPRASSRTVTSPHFARNTAEASDDIGGGGEDIGASAASGKSASTDCTVGALAGACLGGQCLLLCFLCPACLGGAAAGAGAGDHVLGAGDHGIGAGGNGIGAGADPRFACRGRGGGLGVMGVGRSATSTSSFIPARQCPGAPQMK